MFRSTYSLSRSKRVFFHTYKLLGKKRAQLPPSAVDALTGQLSLLQTALLKKDRAQADAIAKKCESLISPYAKKGALFKFGELVGALAFALVFAIIIRQMWFELYEIPTGSMRPTFMEKDRLIVSKTDFGLNIPLTTGHFYFDPSLVQRSGAVTFTGENMDISDADTRYFLIFPGKKQFIKRLMGKPGDLLYFYGGLMYGIDREGRDISHELQLPELAAIDHVPFLKWEGQLTLPASSSSGLYSPAIVHQMGQPVAMLDATGSGRLQGRMLPLNQVRDTQFPAPTDYSEIWGLGNYAMARLLTRDEVLTIDNIDMNQLFGHPSDLYLELTHHPSLKRLTLVRDVYQRLRPAFDCSLSFIPLDEAKLRKLFSSLYTSRFIVEDGFMRRYGAPAEEQKYRSFLPHLEDVPDGTYEFIAGKAYKIGWEGISFELPPSHPLYAFSSERMQLWFNVGIECNTLFTPRKDVPTLRPARYAYFRNGELFAMGSPLMEPQDPTLVRFVENEKEKANRLANYAPFIDRGAPYKPDGSLDFDFIKHYGLQIPEKMYLALGDNHAMSGDSRVFGFVPQENLRGGPLFIFWPPGSHWGTPNQPPYPWLTLPTLIVWGIALVIGGSWWIVHRRRTRLPVKELLIDKR